MRFCLLIGVVVWHVSSSNAMAVDGKNVDALRAITTSANTFAPKFFKSVAETKKGNLICSPASASTVLSMTAFGARGNTETQMRRALALPEDNELAKIGFQTFIDSLNNYKRVELSMANKVFIAEGLKPKDDFQLTAGTSFRSEAQNVDFTKASEASKTINDWCEEKTKNRIKDLIKPDDIDPGTALVLVNAVYFKGNWASQFNPANTEPRPFHVNNETVKDVPTMFKHGSYRYGELPEVKAKFVELPYESNGADDSMSMLLIVPNEIEGLAHLEENFEKINMDQLLNGGKRDVNLYLPKFKIESDIPLNEPLTKMGMEDMFSNAADFTGIIDSPPLKVSKVIQKAFIEVNEEGSEAAAATAVHMLMRCMPQPRTEMKIDRPFAYMIVAKMPNVGDTIEGHVLFSGRVTEPKL